MLERLHFVLGGLCGQRCPRQRPHCSVELKRIVAEKGRRSRGDHLCIVWCAFQVHTKSPSRPCWQLPLFWLRLEQTSMIDRVAHSCLRLPPLLLRLVSGTSRARMTEPVCHSLWRPMWRSVTPSCHFPSVLSRPGVSFNAVMSAFAIARHTRSFRLWYLADRPYPLQTDHAVLLRQQVLCMGTSEARIFLVEDQQRCVWHGRQVADCSRIAEVRAAIHWCEVMTLRASKLCPWRRSDCWSPFVFLILWLLCPKWNVWLLLDLWDSRCWRLTTTSPWPWTEASMVPAIELRDNSCSWSVSVAAAEARKAEEASEEIRRTPRPPSFTGKLAWSHWRSARLGLQMVPMPFLSRLSNIPRHRWLTHSEQRWTTSSAEWVRRVPTTKTSG